MKINPKIGLLRSTLRTRPAATSTWPFSASIQPFPSMTVWEVSQKSSTMSSSMSDPVAFRNTLSLRWWWLRCYKLMKIAQPSSERLTQSHSNITSWLEVLAKSTTWLCLRSTLSLTKQFDRSREAIWLWAPWSTYTSAAGRCKKRIIGTETLRSLKMVTNSSSPTSCSRYTKSLCCFRGAQRNRPAKKRAHLSCWSTKSKLESGLSQRQLLNFSV